MDETRTPAQVRQARESVLGFSVDEIRRKQAGTWQRQAGFAEPVIRQLEQDSQARYADQYVVPLRATRPNFMNRGDNMVANPYGDNVLDDVRRAQFAA
jgi:hypothetical protein